MNIEMDYDSLVVLFRGFGCDVLEAETRAEYIEQCCGSGWNAKEWYYNSEGQYFSNKDEAMEYIKKNGLIIGKDCNIYVSFNGGVWFEYY